MRNLTKATVAIGTASVVLATAGIAYAYWTTTGSGVGSATTSAGSAAQLQVNQTAAPAANQLAPGQAGSALAGDVTNLTASPNGVSYALKAVKIDVTVTDASNVAIAGCDASDYLITSANAVAPYSVTAGVGTITTNINGAGTAVTLTAGSTGAAWTSNLSFVDKPTVNQDPCKSAKVNLAYTTVQS